MLSPDNAETPHRWQLSGLPQPAEIPFHAFHSIATLNRSGAITHFCFRQKDPKNEGASDVAPKAAFDLVTGHSGKALDEVEEG
jgi:hypothetical protein